MGKERGSAEETIKTIRRKTRRQYSAEEKIRIVMEGLRGEDTIAELCRREGLAQSLFTSRGQPRLLRNFWRQVKPDWPVIPNVRPRAMKGKTCARKTSN
jgi:transposase-like protein